MSCPKLQSSRLRGFWRSWPVRLATILSVRIWPFVRSLLALLYQLVDCVVIKFDPLFAGIVIAEGVAVGAGLFCCFDVLGRDVADFLCFAYCDLTGEDLFGGDFHSYLL